MIKLNEFLLDFLILTPDELSGLRPVKVLDTYEGSSKAFHPDGLFSLQTFGTVGMEMRMRMFAYIDLKVPTLHPLYYRTLCDVNALHQQIMSGKAFATFNAEEGRFETSTPLEGQTGFTFFLSNIDKLVIPATSSMKRLAQISLLKDYKGKRFIDKLLVLPAGYRDYELDDDGKPQEGEINPLYRKVLATANLIPQGLTAKNYDSIDNIRYRMQEALREVDDYLESIISGKKKLILAKFATRNIMHSSANVITAVINDCSKLHGPLQIKATETIVGVYQYAKATLPRTIYDLRNGWLGNVFSTPNGPCNLVDAKTLKKKVINADIDTFEKWFTIEGLEKVVTQYGIEALRHKPLMIHGDYIALIYRDAEKFMIFGGLDELPEGFDKANVSPITFVELMYASVYQTAYDMPCTVTRYPISALGGVYPSMTFLKTTVESEMLKEYDQFGQDTGKVAKQFPVRGSEFVNSMSPSNRHIQRLAADYDGDRNNYIPILTLDGQEEVKRTMNMASFHITGNGSLVYGLGNDILSLTLSHMTGVAEEK